MVHARHLLESRPFFSRIPDQAILVPHPVPEFIPGAGRAFFTATRDHTAAGTATYLMIYAPVGRTFSVRTDKLPGQRLRAWWFNPRDGSSEDLGVRENIGPLTFTPPAPGEALDWILVLDDTSSDYPPPGSHPDHVA